MTPDQQQRRQHHSAQSPTPTPPTPPIPPPTVMRRTSLCRKLRSRNDRNKTAAISAIATAAACLASINLNPLASCSAEANVFSGTTNPARSGAQRSPALGLHPSPLQAYCTRCSHVGGGDYCHHRGLGDKATRGCFVLCVTPASGASSDASRGGEGWRGGRRGGAMAATGLATDTVRRTRAGAFSSAPPLSGFLHRTEHGVLGREGRAAGVGAGGVGALRCRAGDGDWRSGGGGRKRDKLRRMFDRIRGVTPPAASAAETILLDGKEDECAEALEHIRAGGNTSTFDADANCPTCRTPVPYGKANLVSKLLFSWVSPLMMKGNKKYLEEEDLWELPDKQRMSTVADAFEAAYAKESAAATGEGEGKRKTRALVPNAFETPMIRALWTLFSGQFVRAGVIRFANTSVQFLPALIVQRLLRLLESGIATGGQGAVKQAYLTCLALFSVVTLKTATENQYFYGLTNLGIGMRGALGTAVYRKSLRLAPSARQNSTVGEIVNYMQIDSDRLESLPSSIHTVWDSVFQMVGYTTLLIACLGPCVLAGIGIMALLIPVNTFFFQKLSKFRMEMLGQTDQRVKLVNEMLQGIRAIKFYNWETPFKERVEGIHDKELGILRRSTTLRSLLVSVLSTTPAFVIVITLGLYSMLGNPMTPSKVFTALALFNQLRFPLYFFPVTLSSLADAFVSIDRLSNFFTSEEVTPYVQRVNGVPAGSMAVTGSGEGGGGRMYPEDVCISMKHGAFYWTDPDTEVSGGGSGGGVVLGGVEGGDDALPGRTRQTVAPALHGCTLEVKKGELVAVVGAVGSGKSSLLSALLGDMKHVSGDVYAAGSLAYVPQTAWIPNDTVRNNILFGKPYDEKKYRDVIAVCRLERDMELLEHGDLTEIGEQGINLSGGQKQRLSLARAIYSDADLFLLDDPLSALDAEVGKRVFEGCVRDALAGRTRVLVTNQLQFLPQVDRIVVMGGLPGVKGATIVDQGTYSELLGRGRDLSNILQEQKKPPTLPSATGASRVDLNGEATSPPATDHHQHQQQQQEANGEVSSGANLIASETTVSHTPVSEHTTASTPIDSEERSVDHSEEQETALKRQKEKSRLGAEGWVGVGGGAAPAKKRGRGGDYWGGGSGSAVPEDLFSHLVLEEGDCGPIVPENAHGETVNEGMLKEPTGPAAPGGGGLITAEERATGAVSASVYMEYLRAAGSWTVMVGLIGLFLVSNFSLQLQQWVVSFWTSDPGYVKHPLGFYLAGVTATAGVVGIFSHIRTLAAFHLSLRASRRLHGALLRRVLHAPVSFFDTTPVGRIVQRFSKDTDQVDQQLTSQITMMINAGMGVIGAAGAIIVATPLFTLGMAPLSFVYVRVMNYFRQVARELKRLDSITRSPIYAHFGETLGGLSAIRAFGHMKLFAQTNERLVDNNLASYFALKVVDRWLSVRLELLGNFVVLSAALLSVLAASNGKLVAGLAGLSITNALSMTGLLNWAVRCYTETETMMNSVERVLYTSQATPQEPPHHISRPRHPYYHQLAGLTGQALPSSPREDEQLATCPDDRLLLTTGWPWEGRIELKNDVTMRYRPDTDLVLKGVTLNIEPGEKVGIVGRTGSGKSSLMQVLFRMVDCEEGSVTIDGVNTKSVGLAALRSRLTIIPQEPVLFSGTLRDNLDPFEAYSDQEVWDALQQASLASTVRQFPKGLLEPVAEYGESLSAGQRQLVCLARALLRKTRVLLLDEATSSVDYETDNVIQSTLRSAFRDCTVLTIAHRLNTIMDSDRILVMDDGKVAELDAPAVLVEDPNSHFSRLLASERRQSNREIESTSENDVVGVGHSAGDKMLGDDSELVTTSVAPPQ